MRVYPRERTSTLQHNPQTLPATTHLILDSRVMLAAEHVVDNVVVLLEVEESVEAGEENREDP